MQFASLGDRTEKGIVSPCVIKDPKTNTVIFTCKKDKSPHIAFPCPKVSLMYYFLNTILPTKRDGDWDKIWINNICDPGTNPIYSFDYLEGAKKPFNYYTFVALYRDNTMNDLRYNKSTLEVAGTEEIICRGPFVIPYTQSFMDLTGYLYPGDEIMATGRKKADGNCLDEHYTFLGFVQGSISRVIADLQLMQHRNDLGNPKERTDSKPPCLLCMSGAYGVAQAQRGGSETGEGAAGEDSGDIGNAWDSGSGPQQAGIITGDGIGGSENPSPGEAPAPDLGIAQGDWWNSST